MRKKPIRVFFRLSNAGMPADLAGVDQKIHSFLRFDKQKTRKIKKESLWVHHLRAPCKPLSPMLS